MSTRKSKASQAQVLIPSSDLPLEVDYFTSIGFRLENIYPADDPTIAIMSAYGLQICINRNANIEAPHLQILTDQVEVLNELINKNTCPSGTVITVSPLTYVLEHPIVRHKFEVRKLTDNDPWVIGRAGMLYRDLIPDRLGGGIIASHIRIPNGGPVPDMVHYHTIGFQLIFCYKGWVKLVYEDQGEPFILSAGDCVTQPPEIRHRVMESSDNLEVIEIGVPAEHMTTIDHEMQLPTGKFLPNREFQGQRFCHHQVADAEWENWRIDGFECRDTGIALATKGQASVQVIKKKSTHKPIPTTHDTDILFTFIMYGGLVLNTHGQEKEALKAGDAFVIPPNVKYQYEECSNDLQLLEVSLPGHFTTFKYG